MTFSTRKEAFAAGLPSYNTGKPCKHGHYSDRYTPSGACKTCLVITATNKAPFVAAPTSDPDQPDPLHNERMRQHAEALEQAESTKYRVHDFQLRLIRQVVEAVNMMRWPLVDPKVLSLRHKSPTSPDGDSAMYFFKLHPDDIDPTRETVNKIFFGPGNKPQIAEHHQRMATAAGMTLEQYRAHADILDRDFKCE